MASPISRILPLLVITLCCIGAVELGYSLLEYLLFRQPVAETVAPGPPAAQEGPSAAEGRRDPNIIVTRNLFGQQAKAEATSSAPAADAAANLTKSDLEIVLVGTVGGSEGTHRAIILDRKTRRQDLYKEGDEIKGASIKEIARGKVILDVQGREELLDMAEAASVRPVAQVPRETPPRQPPQGGSSPGQAVQPETGGQPPVSGPGQAAQESEAAPGAGVEVEPPPVETAPEIVEPENAAPEPAPSEVSPETVPPPEQPQAPQRRIVRPRVIRP